MLNVAKINNLVYASPVWGCTRSRPGMLTLNQPHIGHAEIKRVTRVLESGQLAQGVEVAELERAFAMYCGTKYAVAVNSGTAAIHAGLHALGVGQGDEVIVSPFSFIASVSPALMLGAKVVFADISEDSMCIDPASVAARITKRTKAIVPVDLFGKVHDHARMVEVAHKNNAALLDDACQAVGASMDGHKTGSLGDATAFSLYATKNITCGEGGILTTDSKDIYECSRRFRNHGQKEGVRYEYLELGYNYRMTDMQAAIAIEQLTRVDVMNEHRVRNARRLSERLSTSVALVAPQVPADGSHVFHQYTVRLLGADARKREDFIAYLHARGIQAGLYYARPIHLTPMFAQRGHVVGECPIAERVACEVVSLPVHPGITLKDIDYIATNVLEYVG